jgi:hypothetical protein
MANPQPTTPNKNQPEIKPGTEQPGKQTHQQPQVPNPANKPGEASRPAEAKISY